MKIKYLDILSLFFISAVILISSCKEEDKWGGTTYTKYAPATLADPVVSNVVDTAFTVTYTLADAGALNLFIVPAGTANPDSTDIVNNATLRIEVDAAGDVVYTFALDSADIEPGASFDVFATAASSFGMLSKVSKVTVNTTDNRLPFVDWDACNPILKAGEDVAVNQDILLAFSEDVSFVAGKEINFYSYDGASTFLFTLDDADISTSGKIATIKHPNVPYNMTIIMEVEAGAFIDAAGNEFAGIPWGYAWFSTLQEIDFSKITGGYYVASENEIGFGNGERGGYWVTIEQFDDYTLQINNLRFDGATMLLSLNPADNTFTIADQLTGIVHTATGLDIMESDTDPYGVGASTGLVPGTYNPETGELNFYAYYYISLGQFGFYTYNLLKADVPTGQALGPQTEAVMEINKYKQ